MENLLLWDNMRITKKELKKLIKEAFENKEPINAPATSWELAMEKVYDLAELAQKVHAISGDALAAIQREFDQLDSKAFHMKQSRGEIPQSLMNKLQIMDNVIEKVRESRKASEQLALKLKKFV